MLGKYVKYQLALIILSCLNGFVCKVTELRSNSQFLDFRRQKRPHAILFYHKEYAEGPLQSKVLTYLERNIYGLKELYSSMSFGLLNCKGKEIDASNIKECQNGRKTFMAFKGEISETFDFSRFYSEDSFHANMLMFLHEDKIPIVDNENDWKYEQNEAKRQNKDIILQYIMGVGCKEHFEFLRYFLNNQDVYRFILTTDNAFAVRLGKDPDSNAGLWYARCNEVDDVSPCLNNKFDSETNIDENAIEVFVKLNGLPLITIMNDDGSTVFDDKEINILWVFVDSDKDLIENKQILTEIIKELQSSESLYIRSVIVDRRKHEKYLSSFGVYETTVLPYLLLELGSNRYKVLARQYELFPLDIILNKENIKKHLQLHLNDPSDEAKNIADLFYIDVLHISEWAEKKEMYKDVRTLVLGCSGATEYKEECEPYAIAFRRLARSFSMANVIETEFVYIDMADNAKSARYNRIPALRLYKKDFLGKVNITMFVTSKGILYDEMLQWANGILGSSVQPLPSSGCDYVKLKLAQDIDVNKENLLGNDEALSKLGQEDEILAGAIEERKKWKNHIIPDLSSKSFNKTIRDHKFAVVFFYVTWDDMSLLFESNYNRIQQLIASDNHLKDIKLYKVNCHAQDEACHLEDVKTFPVLRIFKNGKHLVDYNGLLDESLILKTLYLYSQPTVTEVTATTFFDNIHKLVDTTIVGWFTSKNKDLELFQEIASHYQGKFYFLYCIGEEAKKKLDISSDKSTIIAFNKNDVLKSKLTYARDFTGIKIHNFFLEVSLPSMGELTAQNFPKYKLLAKPFLLLFTNDKNLESTEYWSTLKGLVAQDRLKHYSVVWMNNDKEVTRAIRRIYLGQRVMDQSYLVLVDHIKCEVYLHNIDSKDDIVSWINQCKDGKINPISRLNNPKWNPLREGFDFLTYIEEGLPVENEEEHNDEEDNTNQIEEKSNSETKNPNIGNYGHYKPTDRIYTHGIKGPKLNKERSQNIVHQEL